MLDYSQLSLCLFECALVVVFLNKAAGKGIILAGHIGTLVIAGVGLFVKLQDIVAALHYSD